MNEDPGLPTVLQVVRHLEREFRVQYRDLAENVQLPLQERVAAGRTVDGLRVSRYQKRNGRWFSVCHTDTIHSRFRPGDRVYCHPQNELITLQHLAGNPKLTTIADMSPDRHSVMLPGKLERATTWCLDELPNRRFPLTTYPCLLAGALESSCRTGVKLRRWLSSRFTPAHNDREPSPDLTRMQQIALQQAVDQETAVIQGPPGTGKTFLIAAIVRTLLTGNSQARILVSCFSHTAIDNVLREIYRTDPRVACFRVGRQPEDPDLPPGTNTQFADLPATTAPGVWCMTSFKAGKAWAQALHADYWHCLSDRTEVTDEDRALAIRHAWRTAALPDPDRYFDVVIIDEASQMSLPVAVMSLVHGARCILVGDHRQLPPVTICKPDFAPSVFDQVLRSDPDGCLMLDVTHRMNEAICASPSKLFYDGQLRPRHDIRDRVLSVPRPLPLQRDEPDWLDRSLAADQPVVLLTVDHDSGGEESLQEAQVVGRIVAELLARGLDHQTGLAVVCAHRRQNALVRRETERAVKSHFPDLAIDVTGLISDTVELIQGQERDVIIVSLTSSDPDHLSQQWSFSHCPRRFNVCITRPKSKLIVVASPAFFHFTPSGDSLSAEAVSGIAAIKRWYLDRLDSRQIVEVPCPEEYWTDGCGMGIA